MKSYLHGGFLFVPACWVQQVAEPSLISFTMLTEKQIQILKSENDLLQIQLQDVNMIIEIREQELEMLRKRAQEAAAMQSTLDNNVNGFEQMQQHIGSTEQISDATAKRLEAMEDELYTSIKEQLNYAEALKGFNSLEANLADTSQELEEASKVYKKATDMKSLLAAARSDLEIAALTIKNLSEELQEVKALNQLLLNKGRD